MTKLKLSNVQNIIFGLLSLLVPIIGIITIYYQYKFFSEYSERNDNDRHTAVKLKNLNMLMLSFIVFTFGLSLIYAASAGIMLRKKIKY
jgi:hypothetical protein